MVTQWAKTTVQRNDCISSFLIDNVTVELRCERRRDEERQSGNTQKGAKAPARE